MRPEPATEKIHPIILLHAITAAGLHDHYPLDHERVWTPFDLAFSNYERIAFYPKTGVRPGSVRYEAVEPALIRPSEVFGIVYKELASELKHNLSYGTVPVQPVYPFAYDWRQDNHVTIRRLAEFVEEVIARTNLMPHEPRKIQGPACDCVDMIGHSMGGIVIAGCVASGLLGAGAGSKVRRVVTLGTPFRGASAAVAKLTTGLGTLTGREAKERERTTARLTPTTYQLLPSFNGALVDGPLEGDRSGWRYLPAGAIWEAGTYQASIRDTIAEHIEATQAEVPATGGGATFRDRADVLLGEMLDTARQYRALVERVDPATMLRPRGTGDARHDGGWLAIVGCGEQTHIASGIRDRGHEKKQMFDFREAGFSTDRWDAREIGCDAETFTGDETVPVLGAEPPWADSWKDTVVVKRQDFARFGEIGDRVLQDKLGFHGTLPLLNLAQRWIINFLRPEWSEKPSLGQHGKLWGRPLPTFWRTGAGVALRQEAGIGADGRAADEKKAREKIRKFMETTWRERLIPGLRLDPPG